MVGDSLKKDVKGAEHVGIKGILFSKNKKFWKNTIDDFKQLLNFFEVKKTKRNNRKYVIFDMMGVIFKEGHIIKNVLFPLMRKKGFKKSYREIKEAYLKYSIGEIGEKEFNKIVPKEIELEFLDKLEVCEDIFDVLNVLKKKNYKLGILSNLSKKWGYYLLEKQKLDKFFDVVVFSGEYKKRKPNDELYRIFLEKANAKPQNCFLVDDKLENLKEVRFLLMKTIWFKKEEEETLFIPDFIVSSFNDLLGVFK